MQGKAKKISPLRLQRIWNVAYLPQNLEIFFELSLSGRALAECRLRQLRKGKIRKPLRAELSDGQNRYGAVHHVSEMQCKESCRVFRLTIAVVITGEDGDRWVLEDRGVDGDSGR